MPHKAFTGYFRIFLALMVVLCAPSSATAQQSAAEVEIDMTVLGRMPPSKTDSTAHHSSISRPIDRPAKPSLTQPTISKPSINRPVINTPEITKPAMRPIISKPVEARPIKVKQANVPAFRVHNERPKVSRADEFESYRVVPEAKVKYPEKLDTKPKIVSFPIIEKKRSDSSDPSLAGDDMQKPLPTGKNSFEEKAKDITEKQSQANLSPLPELRPMAVPAASAEEEYQRTIKATAKTISDIDKNLPLPTRKPAKMMASKNFINSARTYAKKDSKTVKDISKGGMNMPALPAKRVYAEPLSAPPDIGLKLDTPGSNLREVQNDGLARKLRTPDKMEMLASIEKVTALAEKINKVNTGGNKRVVFNENNIRVPVLAKPEQKPDEFQNDPVEHPVFSVPFDTPLPQRKPLKASVASMAIDASATPIIQNIATLEPAAGVEEKAIIDVTEGFKELTPVLAQRKPETKKEVDSDAVIKISYPAGKTDITDKIMTELDNEVVTQLHANPALRMQINAFAKPDGKNIKNARRGSLSRALAVRNYLIEKGIATQRMDIRAMGFDESDTQSSDRIDLVIIDLNSP